MKLKTFFASFDPLDIFPSVRRMKADLKLAEEAMMKASDCITKQDRAITSYKSVLQQVVNERDSNMEAAVAWKGLSEHLQARFAMMEQRGSVH
jgi:hypothetical protein